MNHFGTKRLPTNHKPPITVHCGPFPILRPGGARLPDSDFDDPHAWANRINLSGKFSVFGKSFPAVIEESFGDYFGGWVSSFEADHSFSVGSFEVRIPRIFRIHTH